MVEMKNTPSKSTGLSIVVTITAIVLIASWLVAFNGWEQLTPQKVSDAVQPRFEQTPINSTYKFLTYTNEKFGFAIQYPVGFYAQEPAIEIPEFRALSGAGDSLPETIEVITDNSATAENEFENLLESVQGTGVVSNRMFTNSQGETVRLIVTELDTPLLSTYSSESATMHYAFYNCKDEENNPYAALVIIGIPKALNHDIIIAQHVVDSFKCSKR